MKDHVYHWKHGWIPLTHFATLQKAHGSQKGAARFLDKSNGHHGTESHKLSSIAHGVSEPISSASQFAKAWDKVRGDILEKHGHPRDLKNAKLANGSIVMDMKHGDSWIPYTSASQAEMRDVLRMHEKSNKTTAFRLRAASVSKATG